MTMVDQDPGFPPAELPLRGLDPEKLLGLLDLPAEAPPSLPGWTILGVAGRGGFGTVWRARRDDDGALAAIKIATGEDPDTLERIEGEIETLRALDHPHIVRLLASGPAGADDAGMFLAMEFVDGSDLSQEIPPGGMNPPEAYRIFRQIAEAVGHAHDHGVLHRDLKPANVMLDSEGQAHVADFGLALPIHRRVHQLSLTRAGMVAGTAEYLPPEAYHAGYQPSPAADIFALGVILHEMLTGTPPRGAWLPASSKRGVDVRIDGVIARAMDPLPSCRWKDAAQMLAELDAVISSPPRYAGTPLVTRPVRFMDGLWILTGLGVSISGLASFAKLRKSRVQLPFDLAGDLSPVLGAFHTLFWLALPALFLGVWQSFRVIRFRHTTLRESLPAFGGFITGRGRTGAVLVGLTQFFCFLLPLFLLFGLFLDSCVVWLHPEDPGWVHGLAVVRWGDGVAVSPWAFASGGGHWLVERFGPVGHPMGREIDRLGFFPFWVPLIMSVGGLAMMAASLVTLGAALRSWIFRGKHLRMIALVIGLAGLLWPIVKITKRDIREHGMSRNPSPGIADRQATIVLYGVHQHARFLLELEVGGSPPTPVLTPAYSPLVNFRGLGRISSDSLPLIRATRPRLPGELQEILWLHADSRWNSAEETFEVRESCLVFYDNPESRSSCMIFGSVKLAGNAHENGAIEICTEEMEWVECYHAEPRQAGVSEAIAWLETITSALRVRDEDTLARCFPEGRQSHPPPINRMGDDWILSLPDWSNRWLLKVEEDLDFMMSAPPKFIGSKPGGRSRFEIALRNRSSRVSRSLQVDLAWIQGKWRCVRMSHQS